MSIVGSLAASDEVCLKSAVAVVFKPGGAGRFATVVNGRAGDRIDIAVTVYALDRKRMPVHVWRVDVVRFPIGCFEPYESFAVPARGDEVGLAIAVYVCHDNVARAFLALRDQVLLPGLG